MLSICGSIYKAPKQVAMFVKSLIKNSTDSSDMEFVCVHDECDRDLETAQSLMNLQAEFPGKIRVIGHTKADRINYVEELLEFYEEYKIFLPEDIKDFRNRLDMYSKDQLSCLWIPPGKITNMAVKEAKGEIVLMAPFDLVANFNPYSAYQLTKGFLKEREHFCAFFGGGDNFPLCHGWRMFDKALHNRIAQVDERYSSIPFSFDERWFIRPLYDDIWNEKATKITSLRSWKEIGFPYYFTMVDTPFNREYLCSKVLSVPEHHLFFLNFIEKYWDKYQCRNGPLCMSQLSDTP